MTAKPAVTAGNKAAKPSISDVIENIPYSKAHSWAIFATIFGFYFDAIDTSILSLALPSIVEEWNLDGGTAGFVGGSIFWGMIIGASSLGFVADLIGRRRVMILTIAGMAVCTAACGLAQDVTWFVVFRVLTGVFAGALIPLDLTYLAEISPKKNRGMIMASIGVAWPLGALTATLLAGWLLPTVGWRWMFIIMLIPAAIALLVRAAVPESPRWLAKRGRWDEAVREVNRFGAGVASPDSLDTTVDSQGNQKIRFIDGVRELFQKRYIKRVLGAIFHYFFAYGLTYGWTVLLPTILLTALGYPLHQTIGVVVLTNVAAIAGRLTIMFTANWWSRYATLLTSLAMYTLLAIGMSLVFGLGSELTWLFIAIIVLFQYSQDLSNVFQQWIPEIFPSEIRGFAASFTSAFGRVAAALAPILFSVLVSAGNTQSLFYVIAGIGVLLSISATVFLRTSETAGKSLADVKAE